MHKRDSLQAVLEHIKEKNIHLETIIDIGVAYGTPGLYGIFNNVHYHLIEPLHEYHDVIDKLNNQYNMSFTMAAAGKQSGTITLNVHPDLSGSSVLKESEGEHVDGDQRIVPQTTLDHEVLQHNLKCPFLVKIDVQGFELEVLEGAVDTLKQAEIVILEVSLFQFYKSSPTFAEVIRYMNEKKFSVYDIFNGAYRPIDDALGQVDILFVKTNGPLRTTQHYASSQQREILTQERIQFLNPKSE